MIIFVPLSFWTAGCFVDYFQDHSRVGKNEDAQILLFSCFDWKLSECSFHDAFCSFCLFLSLFLRIKCPPTTVREYIGHYDDDDVFERLLKMSTSQYHVLQVMMLMMMIRSLTVSHGNNDGDLFQRVQNTEMSSNQCQVVEGDDRY